MRLLFRTVLVLALVAIGTYSLGYWSLNQVTANSWRVATTPSTGPVSMSTPEIAWANSTRRLETPRTGWPTFCLTPS